MPTPTIFWNPESLPRGGIGAAFCCLAYRSTTAARIETLGQQANEGAVNASERADFIAIFKSKARRHLDQFSR
jgi:hypothetical protein